MNEPLRPCTLGEILDRTFQLCRRNFWCFAGVAAVPIIAMLAIFAVFGGIFGVSFGNIARGGAPSDTLIVALIVVVLLVLLPVCCVATALTQGALTRAAASAHLGEPLKIRAVLKSAWPRLSRYVWLMILQVLMVAAIPAAAMLGGLALFAALITFFKGNSAVSAGLGVLIFLVFVACFAAIVWLALRFSLAFAVCVVEEKPAWISLQRAGALSKGTRGRIFVMFLLVWALSTIVSIAAYVPVAILAVIVSAANSGSRYSAIALVVSEIVNILVNFAVQAMVTPVMATALALFYFDQRIRKEGFDIEWMMQAAGLTAPETQPGLERAGVTSELAADIDTVKES